MGAGKRLTQYIEKQGFTKKDFCETFAFEYNSFVQILAETRPFGIKMIDKVHEALPKLNIHWLLYGENKIEDGAEKKEALDQIDEYSINQRDSFEILLIKYLDNINVKNKIYELIENREAGK